MTRTRLLVAFLVLGAFGLGVGAGVLGILYGTGGISTPSRDTGEVVATLSLDGPTPTPPLAARVATELVDINAQLEAISTQVANITSGVVVTNTGDDATQTDTAETTEEAQVTV